MYTGRAPVFFSNYFRGVSFFILGLVLSSCAASEQINVAHEFERKRAEENRKVIVAKVGDVEINKEMVDLYAKYLAPKIVPHGNVREKRMKRIRVKALGEIVLKELKYKEAQDRGISVDESLIDADIRRMEKGLPPGKTLDDMLALQGRDRAWLATFLVKSRVVNRLMRQVKAKIADDAKKRSGPEAARAYYDENPEKFREPDKIRIREILVKVPPNGSPDLWKKSRERAAWIVKRAASGDKFSSLAREFSDDAYSEKGGDMGLVGSNSLMGELQKAVSQLKIGEVAGPIYSMYGHHVVKVLERKEGVFKAFEPHSEKISAYLQKVEEKRMMAEWLDGLKKKNKVEYLYDFKEARRIGDGPAE